MRDQTEHPDQFGRDADATTGGGASTDRGGRDTAMPGPAPGTGTEGNEHARGATGNDDPKSGLASRPSPRPGQG